MTATVAVVTFAGLALSPSASAAPAGQPGAVPVRSCYGGAHSWGLNLGTDEAPHFMPSRYWVTSSRCRDINLKITRYGSPHVAVRVCFYPYGAPKYCNSGKWFLRGNTGWRVIASNVRDGTRFKVELDMASRYFSGYIAY